MPVVGNIFVNLKCNTAGITSGMNTAKRQAKEAMQEVRKEVTESNHSLALMGEAFGVTVPRHIRTFVSELPGVSKAMSMAFDGLAIILVGKVLLEAAEKAKKLAEAFRSVGESSDKLKEGFEKIREPLEATNHQLELSLIKTQNAIAKLEHKPQNNLKEALAEAVVKADELGRKLHSALEESRKLLQEQNHSGLMQFVTHSSGTRQAQDAEAELKKNLAALPHDAKYSSAAQALIIAAWKREEYELGENRAGRIKGVAAPDVNFATANRGLWESQQNLSDMYSGLDTEKEIEKEKLEEKRLTEKEKNEAHASKLDAKERTRIEERLKSLSSSREKLELLLNTPMRSGNQNWLTGERGTLINEGQRHFAHDYKQTNPWETRLSGMGIRLPDVARLPEGSLTPEKSFTEALKKASEVAQGNSRLDLDDVSKRAQIAMRSISWQEATGQISQHAAAMALTAQRTDEYTKKLQILEGEQNIMLNLHSLGMDGLTDDEFGKKLKANRNAQSELKSDYDFEHGEDLWRQQMQTASAGMKGFFASVIGDSENAAVTVHQAMAEAMQGVNAELTKAITGQKTSWDKMFQGLASHSVESGLKQGEGMLMKALGLGDQRPTGRAGDPIHTVSDVVGNAAGSVAGGLMGFIQKLFGGGAGAAASPGVPGADVSGAGIDLTGGLGTIIGMGMIPGFADGGSMPGGLAFTGEKGIELASYPSGTQITSNADLRKMLSGGGGVTYSIGNIDASGSNPAEVEMRVQRAMQQVHQQAVQSSVRSQREMAARRPRSS